jgi:hypothetical protein
VGRSGRRTGTCGSRATVGVPGQRYPRVMDKVFVSSVMRDFAPERGAVRNAIESVGLRAVMAETAPASPDASRQALLPLVEEADAVVLILGARYGFIAESGRSPTEDEFNHARSLGKPVFVFVQKGVKRDPEQDAFVARVGGGWEQGAFTGFFADSGELALGVVKALMPYRDQVRDDAAVPHARERAARLAAGDGRQYNPGSNAVRIALVPVGTLTLIDPLILDEGAIGDQAAALVRQHRLVSQAAGIDVKASSQGVVLTASARADFHTTVISLAPDGPITTDLGARADGTMGGMAISYPRVEGAIAATCAAAQDLWALLPSGDLIRQVAATVCVPEANHHPLTLAGQVGGSMGMPTIPDPLIAPNPPIVVRRAEIGTAELNRRLAVSLKQAFADHGAVID